MKSIQIKIDIKYFLDSTDTYPPGMLWELPITLLITEESLNSVEGTEAEKILYFLGRMLTKEYLQGQIVYAKTNENPTNKSEDVEDERGV